MKTQVFFIENDNKLVHQGMFVSLRKFKEMFPDFEILKSEEGTTQTVVSEKGKRKNCFAIFIDKKKKT